MNKSELGRLQRFDCNFVGRVGDDCVRSEHFAGAGDLQNERLPIAVRGEKLRGTLAQDINAPRRLSFHEHQSSFGIGSAVFNPIQVLQGWLGQRAKVSLIPQFALLAMVDDWQTVWNVLFLQLPKAIHWYA